MDILIGTSLLTAFIAGIAALFAPCCITVLLPSYLGSIFRQKRTVFLMTIVFFFGILAVFLPLGLGIAAMGQLFARYHNTLYTIGGLFLVLLGISILLGKHLSLPWKIRSRGAGIKGAGSIFLLGLFSGFATLCCAPVLAGVMALSALPGSLFWGGLYSLVYAMGMVAPLFIIAYFLDKSDLTERIMGANKIIKYSFFGKEIRITTSELIAGAVYAAMGALTLYLNFTNQLAMAGSEYQTDINIYMARLTAFLSKFLINIPWEAWLVIIFAIIALIAKIAINIRRENSK